jgi:hypothetical protein
VVCCIRVGAHYQDHHFTTPVPADLKVNDTQKMGAALSYAKRYVLCAALNIVVTDEDNDAASLMDLIGDPEIEQLNTLIYEKNVDLRRFLDWAGVESLDKMPRAKFDKALDMLKRKKSNGGGK